MQSAKTLRQTAGRKKPSGFTLIELMIAMAVFLVIGGAALSLFRSHASLFNDQQYQVALNVSLRNALSQMEMDVVNAGTGFYNTADISSWPVGITITNNVGGGACHAAGTSTYNAACFDTLNIIVPDPNSPPGMVGGPANSCTLTTTGAMTLTPVAPTTAAQLAAGFTAGANILFMHSTPAGTLMTVSQMAANATVVGANVNITYTGTNNVGVSAADAFGLTTNVDPSLTAQTLTDQFCTQNGLTTDWVVKLAPITYSVDTATDATNPTLIRTENGVPNPIASQIIGFKVGAATVNANGGPITANPSYSYNSANATNANPPGYLNQWDTIRSVRISLIGRTPPKQYTSSTFLNNFDNQPYKIESLSIIVNPRNLSMND